MGQKEMAINYRTRFAYRIDAWDADGENVIEHLAASRTFKLRWQRTWPHVNDGPGPQSHCAKPHE